MSTEDYQGNVHEYDGILEHDNHLPNWWLMTLFGAIVFSVGYWFYYHTFAVDPGLRGSYTAEWEAREKERLAKEAAQPISDALLVARSGDAAAVARGQEKFTSTCAACHGQSAEGLVGPNLTDAYWVHGGKPVDIYRTVADGVLVKGMPAWKATLGDAATKDVVAYLLTLKGKNVSGPRPAEGLDQNGAPPSSSSSSPSPSSSPSSSPSPPPSSSPSSSSPPSPSPSPSLVPPAAKP
jgi:cytochrome c oxidase cbb3-type subunit 3